MPFVGEHAARIVDPDKFEDFRRSNDRLGSGVDVIFGIRKKGEEGSEIQTIRFDVERFTVDQAKKWLADHPEFKVILFEPAITEEEQKESMREAVLPFKDLDLADRSREWDGDAARRRVREWAGGDEVDFDKYSQAFVVVDGPKENLTSYKLPFADIIDGKLMAVPRGIFAVAAVLQGARGGVDLPRGDLQRARGPVGRYYRKMELTPPWEQSESMSEAFHLRDTHWLPVPDSGSCPVTHFNKMNAPGGGERCYTNAAAEALRRSRMSEQVDAPKNSRGLTVSDTFQQAEKMGRQFTQEESGFKERASSPNEACGACRFYLRDASSEIGTCQVVEGAIPWFATCDLYISALAEAEAVFANVQREPQNPEERPTEPEPTEEENVQEGLRPAFGSPGGKKYLARKIVGLIPEHTKYVEAFVGGGAVFFAKKSSRQEVINDKHKGVAHAYRFIKNIDDRKIESLREMPVNFSRSEFFKIRDSSPSSDVGRFHRFLYLNAFSFGKSGSRTVNAESGKSFSSLTHRFNRFHRVAERLNSVNILCEDFRSVIRRHDSSSTFFYLDPPYPDQQGTEMKTNLTNKDIYEAVKRIKGKFLLSLPDTPLVRRTFNEFNKRRVLVRRIFNRQADHYDTELLISNYPMKSSNTYLAEGIVNEYEDEVFFEKYDGRTGPQFDALKKGRTKLSDEERSIAMKAKAVWHHGSNGEETCAVWKAVVNGRTWFVCNTHRAFNVVPTLEGAIGRFHEFIKGTA